MLLRLLTPFNSMSEMVRQQERIANNLANVNTVGYRRDRTFTQALAEQLDAEDAPTSERTTRQWAEQGQGALEQTGAPLDLALKGEGFFTVSDGAAERYTRAGRFVRAEDGLLRTPEGDAVLGLKGPIRIPAAAQRLELSRGGELSADGVALDRLKIASFEDPGALRRLDGALFEAPPGAAPVPAAAPEVLQGYVEGSNVNPLQEMTDMITHYRMFETQQKMISAADGVLGQATRDLGKF